MNQYLIIAKKQNDYNSCEYEELWLPTTPDEIEQTLHRLGCRLIMPDYEIVYSKFGYPEIDNKIGRYEDILALNRLAGLLQDFKGSPNELSAELVYRCCDNIYEIIAHLANRPQLVVLTGFKDITEYGEAIFYREFWASNLSNRMSYEEYKDDLYYDASYPLWKRFHDCAMEHLKGKNFRFTPYGLVYEDAAPCEESEAPKCFGDIVVPF